MCRRNHKGQQSFSLTFRCDVHIQHSFLHDETVPGTKQHLTSSESECLPMHVLSKVSLFWRGTSFLVLIHLWQVADSTSSPCASSQLVMCMGANLRVRVSSTLKGWLMRTSPLSVVPVTTPSRSDHTASLSCLTGTLLSTSVAALSDLLWYSNVNSQDVRAPTQRCPVTL